LRVRQDCKGRARMHGHAAKVFGSLEHVQVSVLLAAFLSLLMVFAKTQKSSNGEISEKSHKHGPPNSLSSTYPAPTESSFFFKRRFAAKCKSDSIRLFVRQATEREYGLTYSLILTIM